MRSILSIPMEPSAKYQLISESETKAKIIFLQYIFNFAKSNTTQKLDKKAHIRNNELKF